jgi:hypothetical protein
MQKSPQNWRGGKKKKKTLVQISVFIFEAKFRQNEKIKIREE